MRCLCKYGLWLIVLLCPTQLLLAQEPEEKPYEDHQILKSTYLGIRDIHISGNKITKRYIIEREVILKKGSSYSISEILKDIQLSRQNLLNTTLFLDATVDFTNWNNDSLDLVIDVKERWYYFPIPYFKPVDRNLNVWIEEYNASLSRVNYGIKFAGNNVSGRNDKMNLWLISGYSRQIAFNYNIPYIDSKLKQGLILEFAYGKNKEISYATDSNKQMFYKNENDFVTKQLRVGIGYTYRIASIARHTLRLSYNMQGISDSVLALNPKYFGNNIKEISYPELLYQFEHFKVDYIPYPLKGMMWDFAFLKRGMSKDMNLWQAGLRVSQYWQLKPKYYFSLQGVATVKLPFDQPYFNQKLFGYGDAYMRGYEYYVMDGVAGGIVRATFKRLVWSPKLKTGLKSRSYAYIPFRFFLKVYGDMGYAYSRDEGSNFLNNRFLYSGGIGLDMITIYDFSLRFEFSFNQLGENGLFLHPRTDF
ncbi:MAG: hypothetical protein C5B52_03285 [Bacteroidetes bacterium]|nr:MAG: hypothetical protein C5B52_03285 [Bacteroidota bacterium]